MLGVPNRQEVLLAMHGAREPAVSLQRGSEESGSPVVVADGVEPERCSSDRQQDQQNERSDEGGDLCVGAG